MRKYRCLIAPDAIQGSTVLLPAEEAHYLQHVLRMEPGDTLEVFDGQGRSFQAVLRNWQPAAEAEIIAANPVPRQGESHLHLTLALALIKAEPFEWVLQKGTELGVREFIPLHCRHCEVRSGFPGAMQHKQTRWMKIVQPAARQCRRSVVPAIRPVLDFASLASRTKREPALQSVALMEEGGRPMSAVQNLPRPAAAQVWVGPEGGWDSVEESFLRESCFPLGLGPRVLRSETAAIAATVLLQSLWGDL
jgi:16S rRNA (uracil1498-N3)-methyltransferase